MSTAAVRRIPVPSPPPLIRPPLRVLPSVRRRRSAARRDAAFVLCLTVVLSLGVLGVLLLNTSMQQQSDRIARQHQRVAALQQTVQEEQLRLDQLSNPGLLAAHARQLHLRPVGTTRYVRRGRVLGAAAKARRIPPASR